jgi:hypothetical protein
VTRPNIWHAIETYLCLKFDSKTFPRPIARLSPSVASRTFSDSRSLHSLKYYFTNVNSSLVFPNPSIVVAQSSVFPASLADLLEPTILRVILEAALLIDCLAVVGLEVDVGAGWASSVSSS